MFSAINQGHAHPKIIDAMAEQLKTGKRTLDLVRSPIVDVPFWTAYLVNIATHSARWPPFAKYLCERFGYDQVSAMVSGAAKIARKWGHKVKKIPTQLSRTCVWSMESPGC